MLSTGKVDKSFDDFQEGDWVSFTRQYSRHDFEAFARLSGDRSPLHCDPAYARKSAFGQMIVPLHLAAAPLSAIAGMMMPGHRALYLGSEIRATRPVPYDTEITYSARIVSRQEATRVLMLKILAFRKTEIYLAGTIRVRVRDDVPPDAAPKIEGIPPVQRATADRWALVTGASGEIGRAVARRLADRGWNLILQYCAGQAAASETAKQCRKAGIEARTIKADLTTERSAIALARKAQRATAVVHAASPPLDAPLASLMTVNYSAIETLGRALLPTMLARQEGFLVFLASQALDTHPEGWSNYVAAKAAAVSAVDGFRRHFAPYGLRALSVAPGFVATRFSDGHRPADAAAMLPEEVAEHVIDSMLEKSSGAGYVRLDPSGRRAGRIAFQEETATNGKGRDAEPASARDTIPAADGRRNEDQLSALIKEFFGLPSTEKLETAGLDITPGWDSLRHIELLLEVERSFDIRVSADDIDQTTRYPQLRELVLARSAARIAN